MKGRTNNGYDRREIQIISEIFKRQKNIMLRYFTEVNALKLRDAKEKQLERLKSRLLKDISFDLMQETSYEVSVCAIEKGWNLQVLDGEMNFICGIPLFCMVGTLFHYNEPTFSVAYFPFTEEIIICDSAGVVAHNEGTLKKVSNTQQNPVIAGNGPMNGLDMHFYNSDFAAIIFTAIARVDGFALRMSPWMFSIASFWIKKAEGKISRAGAFGIAGNKAIHDIVRPIAMGIAEERYESQK